MSTSTLIKFPVYSFRRIPSPLEEKGIRRYLVVMRATDIPDSLDSWLAINPRDANIKSGVSKKIRESLQDQPAQFLFKNRGITILCDRATFENDENRVQIEMTDAKRNGLLDGGHTYRVIQDWKAEAVIEPDSEQPYVSVEILEGVTELEDAVAIVDSRNTSTQVKQQSKEELLGNYEAIKTAVEGEAYASQIAYKEFELLDDGARKTIDVKDLLSYLVCFDVREYDASKHPIKAYSGKGTVVSYFAERKENLRLLAPLLPQILQLRDVIYSQLPLVHNQNGGRFGNIEGVGKGEHTLEFTGLESAHRIPSAFIYPVIASLRVLVEDTGTSFRWKTDPMRFFDDIKGDLTDRIVEKAKEYKNPTKMGKESSTWQSCYDAAFIASLVRKL